MENLKELAKINAEKQSHVKKGIKDFMDLWFEITKDCETIYSTTPAYTNNHGEDFFLRTGSNELKGYNYHYETWEDINNSYHFTRSLSVKTLRSISKKLPTMINEIKIKLEKGTNDSEKTMSMLNRIINAAKQ